MNRPIYRHSVEPRDVTELLAKLDFLDHQRDSLVEQKNRLLRTMAARIQNVPLEAIPVLEQPSQLEREVEATMTHHQAICRPRLLSESDLGFRILGLRCLRTALIDLRR